MGTTSATQPLEQILQGWTARIVHSRFIAGARDGSLKVEEIQGFLCQYYPIIRAFPTWLELIIQKIPRGDERSRMLFRANLKIERQHEQWWIDFAAGFGVPAEQLAHPRLNAEITALLDWLHAVNREGHIVEAVAATNYAVEGIAFPLSEIGLASIERYRHMEAVRVDVKTRRWLEEHARYDEEHPQQALEVIERYATVPELKRRSEIAADRSLSLFYATMQADYSPC